MIVSVAFWVKNEAFSKSLDKWAVKI